MTKTNSISYTLTALGLFVALYACQSLAQTAPEGQATQSEPPILLTRIQRLDLLNQTIIDALSNISDTVPHLHFGVEEVLREHYSVAAPKPHKFSLHEEGQTMSAILNDLCGNDPAYMWSLNGTTVNVYPRNIAESENYLLNRRLDSVELHDLKSADEVLFSVIHRLIPTEQVAFCQSGGDDSYDTPWTATFSNITVRELLNEAAAHLGPHSYWVLSGSKDFRCFAFAKGTLRKMQNPATEN